VKTYKIVRHYVNRSRRTIKRGVSLKEALRHCNDSQTSSTTCTNAVGRRRTKLLGPWFDAYTEER
jgi:hypothetical protein